MRPLGHLGFGDARLCTQALMPQASFHEAKMLLASSLKILCIFFKLVTFVLFLIVYILFPFPRLIPLLSIANIVMFSLRINEW